jgi:hypothetical protein
MEGLRRPWDREPSLGALISLTFLLEATAGNVRPMPENPNQFNHVRATEVGVFILPSVSSRVAPVQSVLSGRAERKSKLQNPMRISDASFAMDSGLNYIRRGVRVQKGRPKLTPPMCGRGARCAPPNGVRHVAA